MHFIVLQLHRSHHRYHLRRRRHHNHQVRLLYNGGASMKCIRDRGLDHAVEREKNLKPLLSLKSLIISEPSKSLPLSLIAQSKDSLKIPFRPIEFIRRYVPIFEEFPPGGVGIQPHIKLTPEVLNYHKEEQLIYQSVDYKQDAADRLLKLLMVSRISKMPLRIVDSLKWELGLPQDYVKTIVPEFPDYFRSKNECNEEVLELVCWSNDLAVSAIEKKGVLPIEFPVKYSNGFEMDKKYKKWVDEWQKLPYISPYENASYLAPKSESSDKWAVAVLHEILNLFVGKKAEREVVFGLGEWLGLRSRFKRALLQHPGIFYVSSKNRTHTVVLKDGYNRGMLIEKHPLMDMRFKYVHLMNVVKEEQRSKGVLQKNPKGNQGEKVSGNDGKSEEGNEELDDYSDQESDDEYNDFDDGNEDDECKDFDDGNEHSDRCNSKNKEAVPKKRFKRLESQGTGTASGQSTRRSSSKNLGKTTARFRLRTETSASKNVRWRSWHRLDDDNSDDNEPRGRRNSKKLSKKIS